MASRSNLRLPRLALGLTLVALLGACGGGDAVEEVLDKALGKAAWKTVSSEGQSFTFSPSGTYTVRFGANGIWVQKSIVNAGACSVANFGSDPVPGVLKTCQVRSSTATVTVSGTPGLTSSSGSSTTTTSTTSGTTSTTTATNWVKFADEGVSFSATAAVVIRFGTDAQFVEKSVSGAAQCSTQFFGSDPAPGLAKGCYSQDPSLVSLTSTSTTSTTSTTTTSSGTPSTDGTVSAALQATRTSGPAPLAVLFDATGTTLSNGDAFHGLRYEFNFGDDRGQTWQHSGLSKNTQRGGPIAAHVFDNPGTYIVRVRATAANGAFSEASVNVTVQDPNSVYSGASTVCVSAVSNFTGCPAGSVNSTVLPTAYAGKRVLLRSGESFPQITISSSDDNVLVGAFGSGAKPIVQSVSINWFPRVAGQFADDIIIMDLNIQTKISQTASAKRHLYYRNDFTTYSTDSLNRIQFASALQYWVDNSGMPASSFYEPQEIFIVENLMRGVAASTGETTSVHGQASRFAFMGNDIAKQGAHNVRFWSAHKAFVGHNALRGQSWDGIRHALKIHSGGYLPYADTRDLTMGKWATSKVIVANNLFGDPLDNNAWTMETAPQNTVQPEGLEDVILENNRFIRGSRTNTEAVMVGRRMTSRGNSRVDGGIPSISNAPNLIYATTSEWQGPYSFSGDWTVAGVDFTNLEPTATRTTEIFWLLDSMQPSTTQLEIMADATVALGAQGITYRASLSADALDPMTVTLSNGAEITIEAGARTASVNVPLGELDERDLGEDRAIQVFVIRIRGGGLGSLSVSDSNVRTVVLPRGQ